MLLAAAGVALAGGAAQGGLKISSKRFKPKFEHLNVGKGIKRMFSGHAAWGLAKTLLKFAVLGAVAWVVLRAAGERVMAGGSWSLSAAVGSGVEAALKLVRVAALVGLAVAGLDYLMERRRVEKGMRMSRDEIKREHRQSEGDPHQKGALRGRQREISRNRMMADVATADVVLVNPTHVAVALRYESGAGAPRVVAKGAGVIAARIREPRPRSTAARWSRDVPLARALHAACDVGQEIPAELYDAVAQVLAFVMALRTRGSVTGVAHRPGRWRSPGSRPRGAILRSRAGRPMGPSPGRHPTGPRTVDPSTVRRPVKPSRIGQIGVPVAIVGIVVMLVVPLPAVVLDLLIALNITGARADPAGQRCSCTGRWTSPSFPSLILVATLFRLALNVSATRLVLLRRLRRQGDRHLRPLRRRRLAGRRPGRSS